MLFLDLDFGGVLEGFGEVENLDFRSFFVFFSMRFSKCVSKGQKIDQKGEQPTHRRLFGAGLRWSPPRWEGL